jgi:hypothetical protein
MTSNPVIETFQQALYDSQIDPQIRTLYQEMIDSLRRYGGTTHAVAYTLTGQRASRYGSWGHLESSDQNLATQPAPKYQVLLDNFRSVQGTCNVDLTALPLELTDFKAQCLNQSVQLFWTTESELNIKNFELELSYDANHWQTIEQMGSKGNSVLHPSYEYLHSYSNWNHSILYYRLKINELNGTTHYSKVISVMCGRKDAQKDFSIFPNPTYDACTVEFHSNEVSNLEFRDVMGRLIFIQSVDNPSMQLNTKALGLSSGVYFVKSNIQGGQIQKLIVL